MSVYVCDMQVKFGRMIMCHMIADTTEELLAMADRIGVSRKWVQYPGTYKEHFGISKSKRAIAISLDAIEITWQQCGIMTIRRQCTGSLGSPEEATDWYLTKKRLNWLRIKEQFSYKPPIS